MAVLLPHSSPSIGASMMYRKTTGKYLQDLKPWEERVKLLPQLQVRAETLIRLLTGGLDISKDREIALPSNTVNWMKQIHEEREENGYNDRVDVLRGSPPLSNADDSHHGEIHDAQVYQPSRVRASY
jgi:hypothetical protein